MEHPLRRSNAFEAAVLLLVATLPFGGYIDAGLGGNLGLPVFNIAVLGTCSLLAGHTVVTRGVSLTRTQRIFFRFYLLFVVFQWAALLVHAGPSSAGQTAFDYYHLRTLGYLAIIGVVLVYVDNRRTLERILAAGFVGAVTAATIALIDGTFRLGLGPRLLDSRTVLGLTFPFARTTGVALGFGALGMYLLGTWPTYGLLALRDRRPELLAGVIVVTGGLVVGQTRSTWLGALTAMGVLTLLGYSRFVSRQDPRGRALSLVAGGVSMLVLALVVVPPAIEALIAVNSKTLQSRLTQYRAALRIIVEAPLFGVGRDGVAAYTPTVGVVNQSESVHGAVLYVAASSGLPAALCYLAGPLFVWFDSSRRAITGQHVLLASGLAASVAAILVNAQLLTAVGKTGWVWLAVAESHDYGSDLHPE